MTEFKKEDLFYTDYSWVAVPGDDPKKTKEDRTRFSRKEGYEVIAFINSLQDEDGKEISLKAGKIVEWMLHEKLPSNIQGREEVTDWVVRNYSVLKASYPR